jgi:NhaC family Na+:H+ antiporter
MTDQEQTLATDDDRRLPTLLEAVLPLLAMGIILGIGYLKFGARSELLLIASAVAAGLVALRLGLTWKEMEEGIVASISKAMPAMLIVIVVGALIASWLVSGTIPYIVYHGLHLVSPRWFLVTAYLLCSVVSVVIGTSWGTIGTVGVALIGIAEGIGAPLAPTAGAIVAGAYFGDKLSPFSDTTNLAPIAARSNLYDHIGHMLWTTVPAWLLGLIVYAWVGAQSVVGGDANTASVEALSTAIESHFHLHPVLLLPPAITLGAAVLRYPVIPGMLASIVLALGLYAALQPYDPSVLGKPGRFELNTPPLVQAAKTLVTGPKPDTDSPALNTILNRGGMQAMMNTMLIALCAFAFAGIAQKARMLEVILNALSRYARTNGLLIAFTALACLLVAGLTGNSYLAILVPGELFAAEYRRRNLAAKNLSRTTEDSGTVIVPLIPWSISAAFIMGTLDVPASQYAPWAVMCYTGFLFALLYGFTGIGIASRKRDDETTPGS